MAEETKLQREIAARSAGTVEAVETSASSTEGGWLEGWRKNAAIKAERKEREKAEQELVKASEERAKEARMAGGAKMRRLWGWGIWDWLAGK